MEQIIDNMREVLNSISGKNPIGREALLGCCKSLVEGQCGSVGRTKPGSWAVAENDPGMDADARVEFIFLPTYLAVATLTRVKLDFPEIAFHP